VCVACALRKFDANTRFDSCVISPHFCGKYSLRSVRVGRDAATFTVLREPERTACRSVSPRLQLLDKLVRGANHPGARAILDASGAGQLGFGELWSQRSLLVAAAGKYDSVYPETPDVNAAHQLLPRMAARPCRQARTTTRFVDCDTTPTRSATYVSKAGMSLRSSARARRAENPCERGLFTAHPLPL
jgi:hypothetical protein